MSWFVRYGPTLHLLSWPIPVWMIHYIVSWFNAAKPPPTNVKKLTKTESLVSLLIPIFWSLFGIGKVYQVTKGTSLILSLLNKFNYLYNYWYNVFLALFWGKPKSWAFQFCGRDWGIFHSRKHDDKDMHRLHGDCRPAWSIWFSQEGYCRSELLPIM